MNIGKMPITAHLSELRKRITVALLSVLVLFIVAFNFSDRIFQLLMYPLRSELRVSLKSPYLFFIEKAANTVTKLVFLAPAEAFWMHMKIAFVTALVVGSPIIFHQLWLFISPGLVEKERKYVIPFVLVASVLFLSGALFCYIVVLPLAMTFLIGYGSESLTPMLSVGSYGDFCLKFILAFGIVFELPLVIVFLTRFGIVTPATLAKHRKYAVLGAFVLAATLTPTPDAFNQTLMAVPIILLYEIGILVSRILYRKRKKEEALTENL